MDGNRFSKLLALFALLASLLVVAGCGGEEEPVASSPPPDYEAALADAPPPLADLYANGDELVDGEVEAFNSRLESLRGFPVVVNKWASWCGPCREEFPFFQQLSAEFGTRVAFIGVDGMDSRDAARNFLNANPLPYPSFFDPDERIIRDVLGAEIGYPATVFFDAEGNIVHTKFGPYASVEDLRREIEQHALGQPAS